jgi:hypothetical protein
VNKFAIEQQGLFMGMKLLVVAGEKFFCRNEQEQQEERSPENLICKNDRKVILKN